MRTYLVVIDDSAEAEIALRFAARRAVKTGGSVEILAILPQQEFIAFGGAQATIEDEARQRAQALVSRAAGTIVDEAGLRPSVVVKQGEPVATVMKRLRDNDQIAALVLGAAASGTPGPLISYFAGPEAGKLPCPVMLIPGSLDQDAIDRLS